MTRFVNHFNETEPDGMEIVWTDPATREFRGYKGPKFFDQQCFIVDTETDRFWILNYEDRQNAAKSRCAMMLQDPKLVRGIKIMYNYRDNYSKVGPWFYYPKELSFEDIYLKLRGAEKTERRLYFRGKRFIAGRKHILKAIHKLDPTVLIPDTYLTSVDEYFKELASARLMLGLMGVAHACHREIEAFGVGTAVLSRYYRNHFAEPLIPNVHYILAECARDADYVQQAVAYRDTYLAVIDNSAYLEKVAKNAMDWYDRNIRFPNCLGVMKRLLQIGSDVDNSGAAALGTGLLPVSDLPNPTTQPA